MVMGSGEESTPRTDCGRNLAVDVGGDDRTSAIIQHRSAEEPVDRNKNRIMNTRGETRETFRLFNNYQVV
jgi:hypothetical protein